MRITATYVRGTHSRMMTREIDPDMAISRVLQTVKGDAPKGFELVELSIAADGEVVPLARFSGGRRRKFSPA